LLYFTNYLIDAYTRPPSHTEPFTNIPALGL
jgi:hypothetical protein